MKSATSRFFTRAWTIVLTLGLLSFAITTFAQVNVLVNNSNIDYVGRWDKSNSSVYHSYWPGAYLRVSFSGTNVAVNEAVAVNFWADIDGTGYVYYTGSVGANPITNNAPLNSTTHVLTVAVAWYTNELQFSGLTLSTGGATVTSTNSNKPLIEFIGDSITCGLYTPQQELNAYGWLASEWLNCNHTQIAYPGITLVDGYYYTYAGAPQRGMSVQYFWMQEPLSPVTPIVNWNFTNYTPNIVVINLGSNDWGTAVPYSTFQETYITFLQNIRYEFPNTTIMALQPFNGSYAMQVSNAVSQVNAAGDLNVYCVDTTNWLSSTNTYDGTHPTVIGHLILANDLAPILNACLTNTIVGGVYKFVDASGYALEDPASGGTGTWVDQNTYSGGLNQQWICTLLNSNQYKITCATNGLALDGTNWQLTLDTYTGASSQLWSIQHHDSAFNLINVGSGEALDDWSGGGAGVHVISYEDESTNLNQQWSLGVISAAPPPPVIISAVPSLSGVQVYWNASSGASSYNVYRFTSGTPQVRIASGVTNTYYTDTSVFPGANYSYFVTAVNASLESGYSRFASSGQMVQNYNFASVGTDWSSWGPESWEAYFIPGYAEMDNNGRIWQDIPVTIQAGTSYRMTVGAQVNYGKMDGLVLALRDVNADYQTLASTEVYFPTADQNPTNSAVPSSSSRETFTYLFDWNTLSNAIANTSGAHVGDHIEVAIVPYENNADTGWVDISSVSLQLGMFANGTYNFIDNAGYYLADPASGGVGTGVIQYARTGGAEQQWGVTWVTNNNYVIACGANGLALTGTTTNGQLTLQTNTGSADQLWTINPNGSGYNIVNAATGQAIDDWGGGGSQIVGQWLASLSNGNQVWSILPPFSNGIYNIIDNAGYYLADPGSQGVGTGIVQYTSSGGAEQQWNVTWVSGNNYMITCAANGLALTGFTPNGQLTLQNYFGASDQLWTISPNGSSYNIVNAATGQAIDDLGGGLGAVGQSSASLSDGNQDWNFSSP